jgi:hypothetical protein
MAVSLENSLEGPLPSGIFRRLTFGIDAARDVLDTTYFAVSNAGRRTRRSVPSKVTGVALAAYATETMNVGERAIVHAGIRWDGMRDRIDDGTRLSHDAWSPRFGAVDRSILA